MNICIKKQSYELERIKRKILSQGKVNQVFHQDKDKAQDIAVDFTNNFNEVGIEVGNTLIRDSHLLNIEVAEKELRRQEETDILKIQKKIKETVEAKEKIEFKLFKTQSKLLEQYERESNL